MPQSDNPPPQVDARTCEALADTIAIIPMLNEEDSIGLVLDDLPPLRKVIVVDNGCTDRSPEIAAAKGVTIVKQPQRGYGAACLKGIATVAALERPPKIILFLDGDYSDHGEEAYKLIEPIACGDYDMVIGSRIRGERQKGAMPAQAVFGNWLACTMMRVLWRGKKYTDLGPFRTIRWDSLQQLGMQDENFGWTVEMQIKAIQGKLRYIEVPVSYRRRIGASKISGTIAGSFKAGYKIIFTILKYRFSKSTAIAGRKTNTQDARNES